VKRELLLAAGIAGVMCVDVRIDQVAYLNCLNEMFRAASKPVPPGGDLRAVGTNPAAAPSPSVGVYDQAATREMLGQSFGHSVIPARPAPPAPPRFPR
jgi:hypothetical protein